jgi:hypothetical protein
VKLDKQSDRAPKTTTKNQPSAIRAINGALQEIDIVQSTYRLSPEHVRWRTNTLLLLKDIFGEDSVLYSSFASLKFRYAGSFVASPYEVDVEKLIEQKTHSAFMSDLQSARGILQAAIDQIKQKGIQNVFEGDDVRESNDIVKVLSLVDNGLRKVVRSVPKNEAQIQDALESLFVGAGLEFSRGKENILYSSKTYVPDFVFNRISTVVEAKLCNRKEREKEIIGEVNDDILAYRTKYGNLIFVVYDVGVIKDVDQFKTGMETGDHVLVRIVKH